MPVRSYRSHALGVITTVKRTLAVIPLPGAYGMEWQLVPSIKAGHISFRRHPPHSSHFQALHRRFTSHPLTPTHYQSSTYLLRSHSDSHNHHIRDVCYHSTLGSKTRKTSSGESLVDACTERQIFAAHAVFVTTTVARREEWKPNGAGITFLGRLVATPYRRAILEQHLYSLTTVVGLFSFHGPGIYPTASLPDSTICRTPRDGHPHRRSWCGFPVQLNSCHSKHTITNPTRVHRAQAIITSAPWASHNPTSCATELSSHDSGLRADNTLPLRIDSQRRESEYPPSRTTPAGNRAKVCAVEMIICPCR